MIKIITFAPHDNPATGGGTVVYCKALEDLFKNSKEIQIFESKILPHNSFLGLKYSTNEIYNYLNQERPDIIHINGYTSLLVSQLVPLAKKLNIKIVYTAHWHPFYTMRKPWVKELYFYIFNRPYLKKIDAIITINNEDYQFFRQYTSKVHLIPHWIKSKKINLSSVKKIENQILFVGSLTHPNKGFEYLKNLPEGKYKIICVGRGKAKLRPDMTQLSDISEDELARLYRESSLVVIPSHYEAFSYVALEALCSGTPVVMSDHVRIVDHIKDFSGIRIFPHNSPELFTEYVKSTIGIWFDNSSIIKNFSSQLAFQTYNALYTNLSVNSSCD